MRKITLLFACMLVNYVFAQEAILADTNLIKTLHARAAKIVSVIEIPKNKTKEKVIDIVAGQYLSLNDLQQSKEASIKKIKSESTKGDTSVKLKVANIESASLAQIQQLHQQYIKKLSRKISDAQIEQIKNGMTYNVAPNTYKGYQDMLPALTEVQKTQIWNWLVEAREIAMDAETSEKKHWWFGKYKGRINNYLASEGYDLKKEGKAWAERLANKNAK